MQLKRLLKARTMELSDLPRVTLLFQCFCDSGKESYLEASL